MKGIILAGGSGTRLYPLTKSISKQLMPVYDKPMIYYPLSILMLAGIKDILIISTPNDLPRFKELLGSGQELGICLSYEIQQSPNGIAQAFIIGNRFIGHDNVCLILGDNIFYGQGLSELLKQSVEIVENDCRSVVFGYQVKDPHRYGVVEFDYNQNVIGIEEKPISPKSDYALVGLYFFTNEVIEIAKKIKPSKRGELEITDVMDIYLKRGSLSLKIFSRGFAWLDTGTHESLLEASNFIEVIEKRQGLKIACLEEIAYEMGYISKKELLALAEPLRKNQYGQYLIKRAEKGKKF